VGVSLLGKYAGRRGDVRAACRVLILVFAATCPCLAMAASTILLEPIRVASQTYYFRGHAGMASASNQGFMSNAGFVVTNDGVVVFDALASPALGEAMLAAIRKVTSKPVKHVIVSHYHADHFYGLQVFKEQGAQIWAHERARATLASDFTLQRLAERRTSLAPWVNASTRLIAADVWIRFDSTGAHSFSLGGKTFRIIDASGAHSPEDIMLFVEGEGVLFTGDLFFTGRIPFVGDADSRAWLGTLERMTTVRPQVAVPGHGDASTNVMQDIALTRDYLVFLRKVMGEAVAELISFDEAYAKVDWSRFERYPAFREANRLNAYGAYLQMERESLAGK